MRKLALLAAASLAAIATPAAATITYGNQTVSQGDNVLLNNGTSGTTVFGTTNQSNYSVTFTSGSTTTCPGCTTQTLFEPSNGQALIQVGSGKDQVPLQDITISLTNGTSTFGIGYIEFNLNMGSNLGNAISVVINAIDQNGNPYQTTSSIGNGSNFFSALASNGEIIQSISFQANANAGVTDIRQIRLNAATPAGMLPEPSSWALMLLGFGATGFAMRRTRRKGMLAQIA
jgi:hypothetical protein